LSRKSNIVLDVRILIQRMNKRNRPSSINTSDRIVK